MDKTPIGKYRWVIAALLLFATTINYMDRQVISYLKEFFSSPVAKGGFGWSNTDFAIVTSVFTAFYAVMTVFAGWFIDKIGTKMGLALSLIVWSLFGMLNAFAGSTVALHAIIRSLFGIGEGGNFPASIKTVAEWFPKKERALATGIFNSGSSLGAMAAALFVPSCLLYFGADPGWKYAFLITGGIGFVWLFFWFALYSTPAEHKKLSKREFDYIHSDDIAVHAAPSEDVAVSNKIPWGKLFTYPQTWAFVIGKFMTDGVWWFLLFWLPDYLKKQFGFTGHQVMWPTFIVYGIAVFGSTFGGSIPLFLINNGMTVRKARMTAMFIIALFPLLLLLTQYFGDKAIFGTHAVVLAVGVICIAGAAHQAWSANLFTTVSDMFPKRAVGSVTGIGGLAGGVGGVIMQYLAGHLTDLYKATPQIAYSIMFAICALAYIIAWIIIRLLTTKAPKILV
jgi:ACS family hexuronate transporter-like MFS transporter